MISTDALQVGFLSPPLLVKRSLTTLTESNIYKLKIYSRKNVQNDFEEVWQTTFREVKWHANVNYQISKTILTSCYS